MNAKRQWGWTEAPVLAVLFFGALLARVWALGWGLPYVEHVDEPALVEVVVRMVRNGDPNPHSFVYPSLYFYLSAATTRLHAWWGIKQGLYTSLQDLPLQTYTFTTSPTLYVWNRAVTALLGAATVPALYLLGRHMFDRRVGLLGAFGLMVAAFHVEHSHFITTDVPTGLWVVLSTIGAWRVATTGDWRGYGLAAAAAGLAAGTKYNAGAVALGLVVAHFLYWRRTSFTWPLARLVASGGLALLAFLATTPYALLDWNHFVEALRFNAEHYASGSHGDFVGRWQVWEYSKFLWERGLFAPGSVVALLGLPVLVWRLPRQAVLLLSVFIAAMVLLLLQAVNFVRNILPIYPLLILIAAGGAITLADLIPRRAVRQIVSVLLAIALLGPQIDETTWLLRYWSRPYSMVAAAERLRALPRGMRAGVELKPEMWAGDPIVLPVEPLTDHPLEWYRANGFRYLVANMDYRSETDRSAYERLKAAARTVAEYPPRRAGIQPGPGGAILDLGEHLEMMPFVRREMRFGDVAILLGYELQPGEPRSKITPLEGADVREIQAGQPLQINLYWRALGKIDRDYTLFIHVINRQGERVTQRDLPLRYGDYPTSHWQPGELVVDRGDLGLPPLPPGEYRLDVGIYDPETGAVQPVQGSQDGEVTDHMLTTLAIK